MIKREIINCHTLENQKIAEDMVILKAIKEDSQYVWLENGTVIKDMGDGRYYDKEELSYAAVMDNEYDENGELIQGEVIGYVEV